MPEPPDCVDRSIIIRPAEKIAGVMIPRDILFFDCRNPDEAPIPRAHYGERLWGGELAAYSLGLRLSWESRHDVCPLSIRFYFDSRKEEEAGETARIVNDTIRQYRQAERQYLRAKRSQAGSGEGGRQYYKPVACYLANFGSGVIADGRDCVTDKDGF
jgi:hypothetical protein